MELAKGLHGIEDIHELVDRTNRLVFEKDRMETFSKNWKELKGFKKCTPKSFAEAGFYNASSNEHPDNVKCFACQKELSDWEKNDDPWKEHIKRGSDCPFIKFKSKKITVRDFLQLHYEIKKSLMNMHFDSQINLLKEKEKSLIKRLSALERHNK